MLDDKERLNKIVKRFAEHRDITNGEPLPVYEAVCPLHSETNMQRLIIRLGKMGMIHINCSAGCQAVEILRKVGLDSPDLFRNRHWFDARVHKFNQQSDAARFALVYKDNLRYDQKRRVWLVYDGQCWSEKAGHAEAMECSRQLAHDLYRIAGEVGQKAKTEADRDLSDEFQSHAKSACGLYSINAVLSLAQNDKLLRVDSPDTFNRQEYLLNCENGTVDLRTGILRPHDPNDMLSQIANCAYPAEPNGELPTMKEIQEHGKLWFDCCKKWLGEDEELIGYLKRLLGLCAIGSNRAKLFVVFYGDSNTGRSTLLDTIREILGDYATVAIESLLKYAKFDAHPTEMAYLYGKRFAQVSELNRQITLNAARLKQLTGNETYVARFIGRDPIKLRAQFTFIMECNEYPHIKETNDAIWNRLHILEFHNVIPDRKQDPNLRDKLMAVVVKQFETVPLGN